MKAGFFQTDITPRQPIEVTGFGGRIQPALGVHDPLFVKALILDDEKKRVGIVSCDLLGFANADDRALRKAIEKTGVVSAENVMMACVHTHGGPASMFLRRCGEVDPEWMRQLQKQIVQTVVRAGKKLRPVTLGHGIGKANLSCHRCLITFKNEKERIAIKKKRRLRAQNPLANPVDPRVTVIQIQADGKPFVHLLHYACHPVCVMANNRLLTADYCGVAAAFLEKKTGAPTLFLNGACGDLNPRKMGTFKVMEAFGKALGKAAWRVLRRLKQQESPELFSRFSKIRIPLEVPHPKTLKKSIEFYRQNLTRAKSDIEKSFAFAYFEWAKEAKKQVCSEKISKHVEVSAQCIQIGGVSLIGIGGEIFGETGKRIQKKIKGPSLVIGYANGNVGYLLPPNAFFEGGYEADDAYKFYGLFRVKRTCQSRILEGVKRLVSA